MPAPSFVAEYETAWDSNPASITRSVTTAPGDVLVLLAGTSNGGGTLGTPSGGGLTWTLRQQIHISTSWSDAYVWTAVATSSATFDVTVAKTGGSPVWGFNILRFSGAGGVGASSKANVSAGGSTGVSLAITTTEANSAIAFLNADWDVLSGASRAYLPVNGSGPTEVTYEFNSFVTIYAAYHPDAGTAGAKTVGMSAPTGQKYSIVAVEILGAAGGVSHPLAGTVAATTDSSGTITARHILTGTLPATTGTAGAVTARHVLAGTVAATSGTTGTVTAVHVLGGTVAASTTAAGDLTKRTALAGTVEATSAATGALGGADSLTGIIAAVSDTTGELTVLLAVAGTVEATSDAVGAIKLLTPFRNITIVATTVPTLAWQTNGPTVAWQTGTPDKPTVGTTAPTLAWTAAADHATAWTTTAVALERKLTTTAPVQAWATTGPEN